MYKIFAPLVQRIQNINQHCEININSKILKENGCVEPLKGKKSKCVLKIVPENDKCDTFEINVK